MKTILFFLLLGSMFLFNACKNKDCTKDGTCAPEFHRMRLGELKDYLWAKPGSYWIYKQTVTGELDTQVVTDFYFDSIISKGTQDHSKHLTIEYDKLIRNIKSSFNGWTYYDKTSAYNAEATPFKGLFFALNRQAFGGEIYALHYPFNSKENSGTGAEVTSFGGMDSTLNIQSKIYRKVVRFNIDFDAIKEKDCSYIPITTYYWAKDVGLIKKTVNNCNYSWELIEYNIIQ